mmetsp:Transcript_96898/g.209026  ORF Transcript_96898/g.209026 Transcript_96898/m.209026 type:complete len:91 (-) Transcript_96898:182-454(-)
MADQDNDTGNEPITVKVADQAGDELAFKVKRNTKMSKIMAAYADRKGIPENTLRFTLDGQAINRDDTPKMLEMEEGDQIDVFLQQTGGMY